MGSTGAPVIQSGIRDLKEYALRLSDVSYWRPHILELARRHSLAADEVEAGVRGTYPTFMTADCVFKFFGPLFDGLTAHRVEVMTYSSVLEKALHLPVPRLVASGWLAADWCFLILSRVEGVPWRSASVTPLERRGVAEMVGSTIRAIHGLEIAADALPVAPSTTLEDVLRRQHAWGTLPRRLIDQIPGCYHELDLRPRLIHADLHADHIFVDGDRLTGIIDWSDAHLQDPFMELPALHLGCFEGDKTLLRSFLTGYGWKLDQSFAHRAMSATLMHEFDVLTDVDGIVDLDAIPNLESLAYALWAV